ncbi:response regulator [Pleionea sediminis]|uniref:response regulator n=1 Tax=Pleionea sediminis TaxID=2569479 RepID=UPI001184C15C|nr:response regulator [Pleionea sediminis]
MTKILIVDDDEMILSAFHRSVRKYGWQIETLSSPVEALKRTNEHWNIIISDYKMPEMDGIKFLERAKLNAPNALLIIMSANIDLNGLADALNRVHIHKFIPKPWDDILLAQALIEAVAHQQLLESNQNLANQVREQQRIINKQQDELSKLEKDSPGITHVRRDDAGAIYLDDDDI